MRRLSLRGLSITVLVIGLIVAGALAVQPGSAAASSAEYVPGAVIVAYVPGTSAGEKVGARGAVGVRSAARVEKIAPRTELLTLAPGASVPAAVAALERDPSVLYAEPDYILHKSATSNDPYLTNGTLWGMLGPATTPANAWGSRAIEAWAAGETGSSSVYVGIIDTGVQITHPDLAGNMWTNPHEVAGNGIDDDGNGYIDDVNGWDFDDNDNSVYDSTGDDHGTHVSGTIGGVGGNGVGVAGVNWDVTMIPAKFLSDSTGTGSTSNAVKAIDYLTDLRTRHGMNIVATNNSWGGGGYSQSLVDAIRRGGAAGIVFVAAAGNDNSDNDAIPAYPASYTCPIGGSVDCIVTVAAISNTGTRAWFSNYGATSVDLGAPGVAITSTLPPNTYGSYNGTSMATPHVTGAIALCASIDSSLTATDLIGVTLQSVAATASMSGKTVTGGRLDVEAMRALCAPAASPPTGAPSSLTTTVQSHSAIDLQWVDGVTGETRFEIERSVSTEGVCGAFARIGSVSAGGTAYADSGLEASTAYCYRVRGANSAGATAYSATVTATTNVGPPAYACQSVPFSWIDPVGGTAYSLADDASATVTLPFAFDFYGTSYSTAEIASNGFVRLGAGAATDYRNVSIPSIDDPNAFIAPAWDDWAPNQGGTVSARLIGSSPNRVYVVTWDEVPHYNFPGEASFQVLLFEGGDVVMQYRDMTVGLVGIDDGASATAGTEDATGMLGTEISENAPDLRSSTAFSCSMNGNVRQAPPTVTAVDPAVGTTAGGAEVTVRGSGFGSGMTVSFGGVPCAPVNVSSQTTATCTTGPKAAGKTDVVITTSDGQTDTLVDGYSYVDPPPPDDGGGGFTSPRIEVPAPNGVRWTVENLALVAYFQGTSGVRYAITATDGTRTRTGSCTDDEGWVTCRVVVIPGQWVGTITPAGEPDLALAAKRVRADRVARITRPRWVAPTTRRPAVVRFKAASRTRYLIRAERRTGKAATARGRCRVRKGRATCVLRIKSAGRWVVTVTPRKGTSAGKPLRKVVRVTARRR